MDNLDEAPASWDELQKDRCVLVPWALAHTDPGSQILPFWAEMEQKLEMLGYQREREQCLRQSRTM